MNLTPAEQLLRELGITAPCEIDLEAIAYHVGARIRVRPLYGCEARIIGIGDRAIITVNANSSARRKRFSIAHELGHWHHHRGKTLACRAEEYRPTHQIGAERIADRFAADLLMPRYLFDDAAMDVRLAKAPAFKSIGALAQAFETSLTSTAIRVVEGGYIDGILVCHGPRGRKWFTKSPTIPQRWFPQDALDANSVAMGMLFGRNADSLQPRKVSAAAWFDRREAERYELYEQATKTGPDEVLCLLVFKDFNMLESEETWSPRG